MWDSNPALLFCKIFLNINTNNKKHMNPILERVSVEESAVALFNHLYYNFDWFGIDSFDDLWRGNC